MVAQVAIAQVPDLRVQTEIRGAAARLWDNPSGEVIISGPAGTGKTRAILEWIHHRCSTERIRVLLLRKTLESLKGSALVTYQEQVLHEFDGKTSIADGVTYFGGNKVKPAAFTYHETGSIVTIAGMDNAAKVLSTEYDIIYVNEVTELILDEWEKLTGRTDRPRMTRRPPSLVIGDCNPDAPTHWIKRRESEGRLQLWVSVHEDNPAMWDRVRKRWTEAGERYIERLEKLTGFRYQRLRLGRWVAAEGLIYEGWDAAIHLVAPFEIPRDWPRYWWIDFGYVNPFVWLWAAEGPDGELVVYREIYMTGRIVSDHAKQGLALSANEPKPVAVIVDHDAEDRATFARETGYVTTPANKAVSTGIQKVTARLRHAERAPRLRFFRDLTVERDATLAAAAKPRSVIEEFPGYVWDLRLGRRQGEQPLKLNDHGMDATRYGVMYLDGETADELRPASDELLAYFR